MFHNAHSIILKISEKIWWGQCLFTFFLSLRNSSCGWICFVIFLSQESRLVCFRRATDFPRLGTDILLCCPSYFQSGSWEVTLLVELLEAGPLPRASRSLCSTGYSLCVSVTTGLYSKKTRAPSGGHGTSQWFSGESRAPGAAGLGHRKGAWLSA